MVRQITTLDGYRVYRVLNALSSGTHYQLVQAKAIEPVTNPLEKNRALRELKNCGPGYLLGPFVRKVQWGEEPCIPCNGEGLVYNFQPCPDCKGSHLTPKLNGHMRGCPRCHGLGLVFPDQATKPCRYCNGSGTQPAGRDSRLDPLFWTSLPFKVYHCFYYPRHTEPSILEREALTAGVEDADLILRVKSYGCPIQGSLLVNIADELCDHIGIFRKPDGYQVRAVFSNAVTTAACA